MRETLSHVIFSIYFSPYTAHAIVIDGTVFPTVEHAYQCSRYTDQKVIDEIRNATSPLKAWQISQKYKHAQLPDFGKDEHKLSVMKKFMEMKVAQHEDVRKALLDSRDLEIVKHISTGPKADGFWDDGEDGKGLNHIGKIWMEIRAQRR